MVIYWGTRVAAVVAPPVIDERKHKQEQQTSCCSWNKDPGAVATGLG